MTQTDQASGVAPPPPPPPPPAGRRSLGQDLARFFIYAEGGVLLVFIGLPALAHPAPIDTLAFAGAAVLLWGGFRMGSDPPSSAARVVQPPRAAGQRAVPWDWTDVVMFFPAAFVAAALLASVALPIVDAASVAHSSGQQAAESAVGQATFYGGGIFNIWLLVGLRRGGTLQDLGWRRFEWWWLPVAVVVAALTWVLSGWLQIAAQHLFPNAQNTQCTTVKSDYQNYLVLAIIVVSVMAPLAEEMIFRGFVYGWLAKVMPVGFAVVISGAIFGVVHQVPLLIIPLWAVGIVLALMYRGSKSLWPGVAVHALFNLPGIIAILSSTSC